MQDKRNFRHTTLTKLSAEIRIVLNMSLATNKNAADVLLDVSRPTNSS